MAATMTTYTNYTMCRSLDHWGKRKRINRNHHGAVSVAAQTLVGFPEHSFMYDAPLLIPSVWFCHVDCTLPCLPQSQPSQVVHLGVD
jgi:hypothetical protein